MSSPKSEVSKDELPDVTGEVKEEFERQLEERRQQRKTEDDEPNDDDVAAEYEQRQQEIDVAKRIDDLTARIDGLEAELRRDRAMLEDLDRANDFTVRRRFEQPEQVTAQGKILEAMPAPELEDDMKTQEQINLEQRITFMDEKRKELESERNMLALEKIKNERAQQAIEAALDIKEVEPDDEDSDKTITYDTTQAATASTAPPANKKPRKIKPSESKTGKRPVKRKATAPLEDTQDNKITKYLTPQLAAVAKNKFPRIVLTDVKSKKGRITEALLNQAIDLLPKPQQPVQQQQPRPRPPTPPKDYFVEITKDNHLNADLFPPHISKENITYMERRYARGCRDETSCGDLHPFCVVDQMKNGLPVCEVDGQPPCAKYCKAMTDDARKKRQKRAKDWKTKFLQKGNWEFKGNKLRSDIKNNADAAVAMKQKGELWEDDVVLMKRRETNQQRVKDGKVPLGIGQVAAEVDEMHDVYRRFKNGDVIDPRRMNQPPSTTISKMDLGVQTVVTAICKMKDENSPTGSRYFSTPPDYLHHMLVNPLTERFLRPADAHLYDNNINIERIVHPSALRSCRDVVLQSLEPMDKAPIDSKRMVRTSFSTDNGAVRRIYCDQQDNVVAFDYSKDFKDFAAAVAYNTSGHTPQRNAEMLDETVGQPTLPVMAPIDAAFPLHPTIKLGLQNAMAFLKQEFSQCAAPIDVWERASRFESEVNVAPYMTMGHALPAVSAKLEGVHHAYLYGNAEYSAPAYVTQGNVQELEQQVRALLNILSTDLVAQDHMLRTCGRFTDALPQGVRETLDYQSRSIEDRRRALLDIFVRIILWRRKTAINFDAITSKDVLIDLLTAPIVDTTSLFHSMHIIIIFVCF